MPVMKLNPKKKKRQKSKKVPFLSLIVLVRSSGLHLLSYGMADERRFVSRWISLAQDTSSGCGERWSPIGEHFGTS